MNASDRKRILASRRVKRLTLAVMLKDNARPDMRPEGELFLKTAGEEIQPALYGIYPFVDLPGNNFTITVGGRLYQEETIRIDLTGLEPEQPFKEISLKPKGSPQPQPQPEPQPDTVLTGKILDFTNNTPVAGAQVTVKTMAENAVTGADGGFSITFMGIEADRKVTLSIKKDVYKPKEATVQIKKQAATVIPDIKLTRK